MRAVPRLDGHEGAPVVTAPVDIEAARLAVSQCVAHANRAVDALYDATRVPDGVVLDASALNAIDAARERIREATAHLARQYDRLRREGP